MPFAASAFFYPRECFLFSPADNATLWQGPTLLLSFLIFSWKRAAEQGSASVLSERDIYRRKVFDCIASAEHAVTIMGLWA